ncbi:MAG: hypothetical protein CBB97_08840 [Candidatus Endolissoclinum sp. TMED37]|nr:MAG: hypothetical protein CBB97_08840 [Candidatus Endolissoclinum sp. TMED37]
MLTTKTSSFNGTDCCPNAEEADPLQRIQHSLRKAAVDRNVKTAMILGAGASGALISLPWFAATAAGTTLLLTVVRYRQQR